MTRAECKASQVLIPFVAAALLFSVLANLYLGHSYHHHHPPLQHHHWPPSATTESEHSASRMLDPNQPQRRNAAPLLGGLPPMPPHVRSQPHVLPPSSPSSPSFIQVAVVSSFQQTHRLERLVANSQTNGWHQEFPGTRFYTFDQAHPDSPLWNLFTPMTPLFPDEKIQFKGNHQLAALEYVYRDNPHAAWYIVADDDTVLVPANLRRMIADLNLASTDAWYVGKCASFDGPLWPKSSASSLKTEDDDDDCDEDDEEGRCQTINFLVGGAGILLSHALMEQLAPVVQQCRRDYNHMTYGDGRIGACIQYTLNMSSVVKFSNSCSDHLSEWRSKAGLHYKFYMGDVFTWSRNHYKSNYTSRPEDERTLIMNVHEKDVAHIRLFNEWFRNMSLANRTISWSALQTDTAFNDRLAMALGAG
jgi:hypothetical protein